MSAAGPPQGARPPWGGAARSAAGGEHTRAVIDSRRLARLRWRCRRGLLENDLVLERYLNARGDAISENEVAMLDRLLDLPDQELWDLVSGRAQPSDPRLGPMIALLAHPPLRTDPSQTERM